MLELKFRLKNNLPFASLSESIPEIHMYRWCSSAIDYLEIYGQKSDLIKASQELRLMVSDIESRVIHESMDEVRLSVAIACRCSIQNSTIRIAESRNLLWQAPAEYKHGEEIVKLISFNEDDMKPFFDLMQELGEVSLERKTKIQPDSLRDVYTISISELLEDFTAKQLKYLKDAIGMGLFSTPRKSLVEDVARINGVSKSTMQEHINKARNKLIRTMEPYLNLYVNSKEMKPASKTVK